MKKAMLIEDLTGEVTEIPVETVNKSWHRKPANYQLGQFDKDIEKNMEKVYDENGKVIGEKKSVSLTVPDQSYTIREILERFTRGVPMDISKQGVYEEVSEADIESFENAIDITEVEEKLSQTKSRIEDRKTKSVENTLSEGVVKGAEKSAPDITKA